MNFDLLIRGAPYLILAAALLTTAVVLNNRQAEISSSADNSDAELIRCQVLRKEAANSAACKAVWQARRERFLNTKKAYAQQGLTGTVPAAPDPKESSLLAGEQLLAPADRTGRPQ